MNPANLILWHEGSAVWALDAWIWWAGTVMEENSDFCVVRLVHGVSLPVSIDNLKLRDPGRNGADRPAPMLDPAPAAGNGHRRLEGASGHR